MASSLCLTAGFLLLLSSLPTHFAKRSYKGYKIYEVIPRIEDHAEILHLLSHSNKMSLDFISLHKQLNVTNRIFVSPKDQPDLEFALNINSIAYKIVINDFSETIRNEEVLTSRTNFFYNGRVSFNRYLRADEINAYLDAIAKRYKNRAVLQTVGKSFEGRPLKVITISNGNKSKRKQTIFIDAGIHAREWIAPATALYGIYQLLEKFHKNTELLEFFDWIIMPLVNPDGYEYSHTKDRMWRKTRKPNNIPECTGTDGNRNYDHHWAEYGSSSNQCNQLFHGSRPFSEPETQAVRTVFSLLKTNCVMYLSLHSYGSYILYPWAWTSSKPDGWRDIQDVGKSGANAMCFYNQKCYQVGNAGKLLYPASGGSMDYAFAKAGIPISLTMELPYGGTGFDPKRSEIKSFVRKAWNGIKAMARKLRENNNLV